MRKLIIFSCVFFPFVLFAQTAKPIPLSTFDSISVYRNRFEVQALDTIVAYMDSPERVGAILPVEVSSIMRAFLLNNWFDYKEHFDWDSLSSVDFTQFLAQNRKEIVFSVFLGKYTTTPLRERAYSYRLKRYETDGFIFPFHKPPIPLTLDSDTILVHIKRLWKSNEPDSVEILLQQLVAAHTVEAFAVLRELLKADYWLGGDNDEAPFPCLCKALRHYETLEALTLLLDILKSPYDFQENHCYKSLEYITSINETSFRRHNRNRDEIVLYFHSIIDSLGSLEAIRTYGYQLYFPFGMHEFDTSSDYYGHILLESGYNMSRFFPLLWRPENTVILPLGVHYQAFKALVSYKDSRMLRYLGALAYREIGQKPQNWPQDFEAVTSLKDLTGVEVEVLDGEGNWTVGYNDDTARLNFLLYWYNHAEDYVWDEEKKRFVNVKE